MKGAIFFAVAPGAYVYFAPLHTQSAWLMWLEPLGTGVETMPERVPSRTVK